MLSTYFWNEFYRLKVHARYISLQQAHTENIDRCIKIFLAITASSSIGAWAVWQDLGPLWGLFIATSQVINSIRPYLPYKKRLIGLSSLSNEYEELAISFEMKWLDISTGSLTDDEIKKAIGDIKTKKQKAMRKHFQDGQIPEKSDLLSKAEEDAQQYLRNFYS